MLKLLLLLSIVWLLPSASPAQSSIVLVYLPLGASEGIRQISRNSGDFAAGLAIQTITGDARFIANYRPP